MSSTTLSECPERDRARRGRSRRARASSASLRFTGSTLASFLLLALTLSACLPNRVNPYDTSFAGVPVQASVDAGAIVVSWDAAKANAVSPIAALQSAAWSVDFEVMCGNAKCDAGKVPVSAGDARAKLDRAWPAGPKTVTLVLAAYNGERKLELGRATVTGDDLDGDGVVADDCDDGIATTGKCDAQASCVPGSPHNACRCNGGWGGDGATCTDVNECATANGGCDRNATCANTAGSRTCTCKDGFFGSGTSCQPWTTCNVGQFVTRDPTATSDRVCAVCQVGRFSTGMNVKSCSAWKTCAPGEGYAAGTATSDVTCTPCGSGYASGGGTATCVDIDECALANGGCAGACTNAPGTRICSCAPGLFLGNDATSCANCVAGTSSAGGTTKTCSACDSGKYSGEGAASCTGCALSCAAGRYESTACTATTNRACTACSGIALCTSIVTCSSATTSQCTACTSGYTLVNGAADTCADQTAPSSPTLGTTTKTTSSFTVNWSPVTETGSGVSGYRLAYLAGTTAPADCTGTFTAISGSAAVTTTVSSLTSGGDYAFRLCTVDVAGNVSSGSTGTMRLNCSGGSAPNGSGCSQCTAGSSSNGTTSCAACASGSYSVDGATSCTHWTTCAAGSGYAAGTSTSDSTCTPCTSGNYSTGGTMACNPWQSCASGYRYTAGTASTNSSCAQCGAGTVSPGGTTTTCSTCDAGAFSGAGAGTCTTCAPIANCTSTPTCTSTADSQCTSCTSGYTLVDGTADTCFMPPGSLVTKTLAGQTFEFSYIAAGTFTMGTPGDTGSEYPHAVTLSKAFLLQRTETTQAQYQAVIGSNPSYFKGSSYPDAASRPVEQVSWTSAVAYCDKLSQLEGVTAGTYGLPTEAQWEYAARAGTTGSTYGNLADIAWYWVNSISEPHAVKAKQANDWNLYDMLGNVWEWTEDWYSSSYYASSPSSDPTGPSSGYDRVLRGGSWYYDAKGLSVTVRHVYVSGYRTDNLGFRPRRSLP